MGIVNREMRIVGGAKSNNAFVRIPVDLTQPTAPGFRPYRICLYGDSNTVGFCNGGAVYVPYGKSLSQALAVAGAPCEIILNGLCGLTGQEMAVKLDSPAISDLVGNIGKGILRMLTEEGHQDLAIIMVGTNDIGQSITPEDTLQYTERLHGVCHDRGIPTIALGPPTLLHGPYRAARQRYVKLLENWARANQNVLAYFDCEVLAPRSFSCGFWAADELHMTPAGNRELGLRLAPAVLSLLKQCSQAQKADAVLHREHSPTRNRAATMPVSNTFSSRTSKPPTLSPNGYAAAPVLPITQDIQNNIGKTPISPKRADSPERFQVGQLVEYYSTTKGHWIPCSILEVNPNGSIQIDAKSGYWISIEEQALRVRTPTSHPDEGCPFRIGQDVEYQSVSNVGWIPCKVVKVCHSGSIQVDVKPGHWFTKDESSLKIRGPAPDAYPASLVDSFSPVLVSPEPPMYSSLAPLQVGLEVEYKSTTKKRWVLCRISAKALDGAIEVDAKPGYWIPKEDHATRIRPPGDESRRKPPVEQSDGADPCPYQVGQAVEYFSISNRRWVPCCIESVEPNGCIKLDVKPGYKISRQEQLTKVRLALPGDDAGLNAATVKGLVDL